MKKIFLLFILLISPKIFAWSEPIITGAPIKAFHVDEIRNVINLKRQCYGVPNATWTDATITPGTTKIKSVHLTELRSAINSLYTSCSTGLCSGGSGSYSSANKSWTTNISSTSAITPAPLNEIRAVLDNITCTPYTYNWLVSSYGSCTGGSGTWSYSPWGNCFGGSISTSCAPYTTCSNPTGVGTKSRTCTNTGDPGSGDQVRSAVCNYNANSGTQSRTVQCQRNDSIIVADSFCTTTKPPAISNCTPTDSSVCGPSTTTQSCAPTPSPSSYTQTISCCIYFRNMGPSVPSATITNGYYTPNGLWSHLYDGTTCYYQGTSGGWIYYSKCYSNSTGALTSLQLNMQQSSIIVQGCY